MSAVVTPFPLSPGQIAQVGFDREELTRILDLYGRMVAAGQWRDYAMNFEKDAASFSAYRRASERPQARIEKRPALRGKQGMYAVVGADGQVLRRGHELPAVLKVLEKKLIRPVD